MQEIKDLTIYQDDKRVTEVFLGYHRQKRYRTSGGVFHEGAMTNCRNMATEEFPCAASREKRVELTNRIIAPAAGVLPELKYLPGQLLDALYYNQQMAYLVAQMGDVLGTGTEYILYGSRVWEAEGSATPNDDRLIAFANGFFTTSGIYIPDKDAAEVHVAALEIAGIFKILLTVGGEDVTGKTTVATTAPESPSSGDYWQKGNALYLYDGSEWKAVPVYYIILTPRTEADKTGEQDVDYMSAEEIAALKLALAKLRAGDRTELLAGAQGRQTSLGTVRVHAVDADGGTVTLETMLEAGYNRFELKRKMPVLDHIVAHDNRVWGCRYGANRDGATVNEIYASALGDPLNWFKMDQTEDDSFIASVGEPGPWTGAAALNDTVIFFKENCMLTVYGDGPGEYRTTLDYCDGVELYSERSIVYLRGYLYYKSTAGIMRLYSGTLPAQISDAIAYKDRWEMAAAGTDGRKYYIQMRKHGALLQSELWVYDAATGEWQQEDAVNELTCFVEVKNGTLAVCGALTADEATGLYTCKVLSVSHPADGVTFFGSYKMLGLCGAYLEDGEYYALTPDSQAYPTFVNIKKEETEEPLGWFFDTGDFGHNAADYKRVKSVAIRAWCDKDAAFDVYIQYDQSGEWVKLTGTNPVTGEGTRRVEYRLRACDLYRFRISGSGRAVIYSITHTYETEGNRNYDGQTRNQVI